MENLDKVDFIFNQKLTNLCSQWRYANRRCHQPIFTDHFSNGSLKFVYESCFPKLRFVAVSSFSLVYMGQNWPRTDRRAFRSTCRRVACLVPNCMIRILLFSDGLGFCSGCVFLVTHCPFTYTIVYIGNLIQYCKDSSRLRFKFSHSRRIHANTSLELFGKFPLGCVQPHFRAVYSTAA